MQLTRVLSVAVLAVLSVLGACSDGSSFSVSSSIPPPFPPPSLPPPTDPSAGGDAAPAPCPSNAPSEGATCGSHSAFATCQFGPDVRDECDETFTCEGQRWTRNEPATTCELTCPATFDALPIGAACADDRVACSYEEGTCACVGEDDDAGAADAGDPDAGDAGDAGGSALSPGVWKCVPPPSEPGCPSTRPRDFDPCVKRVHCDYGTCELRRPLVWFCGSSQWSGPATRACGP